MRVIFANALAAQKNFPIFSQNIIPSCHLLQGTRASPMIE